MYRYAWSLLLCLGLGCGNQAPKAEQVPLDKVPANVLSKAKEVLPEVKFETAVRRSDGGLEIRGKDPQGKVRDVEFSAQGEFLEVE